MMTYQVTVVLPLVVVWGERDPALRVDTYGEIAREAAGLDAIHRLAAKHFLQEDQSVAIADLVSDIAASERDR